MSKTYKYIVLPGQNLIDIAMQVYGSAEALLFVCIDNDLDVGDSIVPGQELIIDIDKVTVPKLVEYYSSKYITIANE